MSGIFQCSLFFSRLTVHIPSSKYNILYYLQEQVEPSNKKINRLDLKNLKICCPNYKKVK